MLTTIEEKLSAIKAINDQKDKIDGIIQRIQLNPDKALQLTVDNIPLADVLSTDVHTSIYQIVMLRLEYKRNELISQATELMK